VFPYGAPLSDDLREFLANARAQRSTTASSSARVLSLDELHLRGGQDRAPEPWGLAALRGRLVELSARGAAATLTTAIDIVLEAQREAEPVAWIVPWANESTRTPSGTFYPPDAADSGVDLSALVVVRAPTAVAATRSAERLLRSGAFGLVVLDFGSASTELTRMPEHFLGRLVTLAQAHDAAIVCLTEKASDAGSLGSLVSLRAEALRARGRDGFEITVRALKDKRRGPGWSRASKARGPAGL
jgi:recombination protein RecA